MSVPTMCMQSVRVAACTPAAYWTAASCHDVFEIMTAQCLTPLMLTCRLIRAFQTHLEHV